MQKELIETGKSVDAAIESACEKLGCQRDDCEWEIIDLPRKGFLGLKNIPAKVRVCIEVPDEKPAPQKAQAPAPKMDTKPAPRADAKPAPKTNAKYEPKARPQQDQPFSAELIEKEKLAKEYLAQMLLAFGLKAELETGREFGGSCINIAGDGMGAIIGRRGETLDAIQYLVSLVANRGDGEYLRITVDCGNYRLKRKDTLEALAKKLANQVLKTNVSKTLEPMNPFERRIIHATVSEMEGVTSSSIGEEPNRRVVITAPGARPARPGNRPDRGGYRGSRPNRNGGENKTGEDRPHYSRDRGDKGDRGGRNSRGGRDNRRGDSGRPTRQAAPVPQGPPRQTPESAVTSGVSFGKIDLD